MSKLALALCAGSTFLGAALLFAVQPLLAKWLLPWFGGSPSTWAACMVFFQGMLLGGYIYAHALARWLTRPMQLAVHALTLAIAAAAFVFPFAMIGLYEGGYNHVLKNVLYFGGASPELLAALFPPPAYELPDSALFEVSGIAQLAPAVPGIHQLYKLVSESR